jgi:hypothetical protein
MIATRASGGRASSVRLGEHLSQLAVGLGHGDDA